MALYYELPVYKDTYELVLSIFAVTQEYPRDYKHTLGQDMKRDVMELIRCIYRANRSEQKREHLEAFLEQFELLKLELRVSYDLQLVGLRNYTELSVIIDKIGKQVTGWKNHVEKK